MVPLDVFHLPVGLWTLRNPQKPPPKKNSKTETQTFLGHGLFKALLPTALCASFLSFSGGPLRSYIDELRWDHYPDILPPFGPLPTQI